MAEENKDSSHTPEQQQPEVKSFSQEEVDRIISTRLREERSRVDKTVSDAVSQALAQQQEAQRIASLQGEEKLRAEYEAQIQTKASESQKMAEELTAVRRALATTKAEAELAKLGLPSEFAANLLGESDEATMRNIQAFNAQVNELVTKRVNESVSRGTPKAGGTPSQGDDMLRMMRAAAGLGDKT